GQVVDGLVGAGQEAGGALAGGDAGVEPPVPGVVAAGQGQGADLGFADDQHLAVEHAGQVQIVVIPRPGPQPGAVAEADAVDVRPVGGGEGGPAVLDAGGGALPVAGERGGGHLGRHAAAPDADAAAGQHLVGLGGDGLGVLLGVGVGPGQAAG